MEQEKQERRDNFIDRLNNAYSSYQNARLMLRLGRGGAGIARAAAPLLFNPYVLIGIVVILIIFVFIIVLTGGPGGIGSQTGANPTPPSSPAFSGLDYAIPFRDSAIRPADPDGIKKQVLALWPNAKIQNWETIVGQSINNGWNPAFVLALWIEETGAQGVGSYTDPLGCDPSHPTTDITISLRCLFSNFNSYANDKFADFMCRYSESKNSPCDFLTNPNFPKNIKSWYSQLVPTGNGSLVNQPINPPAPNTQTLRGDIKNQFGIEVESDLSNRVLAWAWEALWTARQRAPNFFSLLRARYSVVNIKAGPVITNTSGNTITIKNTAGGPLYSEQYFKQIFIHELGHVIYGPRSSPNPTFQSKINEAIIKDGGTITAYAENSTKDPNRICDNPDSNTKASEDFADSVSYFININQEELTYGCGIKNPGKNPFQTGKYPNHLLLMQNLLLGTSF